MILSFRYAPTFYSTKRGVNSFLPRHKGGYNVAVGFDSSGHGCDFFVDTYSNTAYKNVCPLFDMICELSVVFNAQGILFKI